MAKDTSKLENAYKIKLLRLWEILQKETDDQHPLSTQQLIARLAEHGIKCDRKVLSRDVAQLMESGYPIEKYESRIGHSNGYFVCERHFEDPELRILIDAVRAASFISPKKTEKLVGKIAELGGDHRAEQLLNSATRFVTRKHSNEKILYYVDALDRAIREKKQATFHYFRMNENREKVYGHEGAYYVVNPVAMLCNEDNYYLICWNEEERQTRTYRIDRMEDTAVIEDSRSVVGITEERLSELLSRTFKMYGGENAEIELAFTGGLISVMQDQFGEDLPICPTEQENIFTATVRVQISDTFWGWLFQFVGQMKILSPASAVREYHKKARAALKKDPLDPESEYITDWDEDF